MRILGLDFETTGVDTATCRITEMGIVLWEVEDKRPLVTVGTFFHDEGIEVSPEITELTGIKQWMLQEFGTPAKGNLEWLEGFCKKHRAEYIVAHNGKNYDKPLLYAELTRHGVDAPTLRAIPWIDSLTDIPFLKEPDSRRLLHLASEHGFLNPFAHRAVFDVLTMLRILAGYDFQKVLEFQRIPFVTLRACVGYELRELAKKQRYSWEKIGEKTYPKFWVKRVKENLMEAEVDACKKLGFDAIRIE